MKRIIIHWTGGTYAPNSSDLLHYHFVVGGSGKVHNGKFTPKDNENCNDGRYAQHCGGGNTGSIGISMACMFGFKDHKNVGNYPMTKIQFEACMKKVAQLCSQYKIEIASDTVLTHYELGLKQTKTTSYGKPDIIFIPPYPNIKTSFVGNFIRNKIRCYKETAKKNTL